MPNVFFPGTDALRPVGRGSARAVGGRHGLGLRVVTRHGSDGASPYRPERARRRSRIARERSLRPGTSRLGSDGCSGRKSRWRK